MTAFKTQIFIAIFIFASNAYAQIIEYKKEELPILISKEDQIDSINRKGDSLSNLYEFTLSRVEYFKAFQIARSISDKKRLFKSGIKTVYASVELNEYNKAKEILSFLEVYCQKIKDTACLVEVKKRYGGVYHKLGKYKKSLNTYNQAFKLIKNVTDSTLIHNLLLARAYLFVAIENNEGAKNDYLKALDFVKDEQSKAYLYGFVSTMFRGLKSIDSTLYYIKRSNEYMCSSPKLKCDCYNNYNSIAYSYILNDQLKKAEKWIKKVDLNKIDDCKNHPFFVAFMHTLGVFYFKSKEYTKSLKYYEIALEQFLKHEDIQSIILTYKDLSKNYEALKDHENSLIFLNKAVSLKESFDNLEVKKQIAKLEAKKQIEENKKKLSNLREVNMKQGEEIDKVKLVSYLLTSSFIVILIAFLYHEYKNKIRFHQISEELSINRFKSLRSMMNPHFLFNSFSTLQNYILKNQNLKAVEYMTELSGLIRKVLSSSDSIYTNFDKELDLLKSYINIEKGRFEESFEAIYHVDQNIKNINPTIPSMIIQPYIENAIIHGFSHVNKKGLLKLSFTKGENVIICKIEDNGIGRDEAERLKMKGNNAPHLSIATRNTNERLRILNKIGSHNAGVRINDLFFESGTPKGTEVVITLPINQKRK